MMINFTETIRRTYPLEHSIVGNACAALGLSLWYSKELFISIVILSNVPKEINKSLFRGKWLITSYHGYPIRMPEKKTFLHP